MNHLPVQTLRDLGVLLVVTAELAWQGTKKLAARLEPLVTPPEDIEVRSRIGSTYSGVLLIERNRVLAGIVIRTGHHPPRDDDEEPSLFTTRRRRPFVTPPPVEDDPYRDHQSRLPGWAEDPRDRGEEEELWPYRR